MPHQQQAIRYGLAAVLLWSTVATAFKLSLQTLSPVQLLFYSSISSLLVLGSIIVLQGKLSVLKAMSPRQWLTRGMPGLLNPWLYYLVLFKAYELLPAQEAQPLNYTWAITLSILAVPVLGHKLRLPQLGAIALSYLGVLVIATHGNLLVLEFSNGFGVTLALGSTLIWAAYWLWQTHSKVDPVIGLFCNFLFALPFIALTLGLTDGFALPPWKGVAGAFYVGLFEMGLAFLFWLKAMQLTTATSSIANLIYLSPFLSLIFIHLLVGEKILVSSLVGLVLIVAGVFLQQHTRKRL